MKQIRLWAFLLLAWILLTFILGRFLEPLGIDCYWLAFVIGGAVVAMSRRIIRLIPTWVTLVTLNLLFIVWKTVNGGIIAEMALPITILEVGGISISSLLGIKVSRAFSEFEKAVAQLTIGSSRIEKGDGENGFTALYREVRRARNHQRPLTLLAVAIDEESIEPALDNMVKEAQNAMMNRLMQVGVSKILCERLEDCDIVAQANEHFLVVLPETIPENLPGLVSRLRRQVLDQVGVNLKIGAASLPQDGYTFDGLLHKAADEMQTDSYSSMFEISNISVDQTPI